MKNTDKNKGVAAVIPCYRAAESISHVIRSVYDYVEKIYVVDDKCPENSWQQVKKDFPDGTKVVLLQNEQNMGVGGAVKRGLKEAQKDQMQIAVKVDADGQMKGEWIPKLIKPIQLGKADYTKGNRFWSYKFVKKMPLKRFFGNAALSFITKISTGYWNSMDPTNGFIAINCSLLSAIELDTIENRYFFELDMLFKLGLCRAVVKDIPFPAVYEGEKSSLSILTVLKTFPNKIFRGFIKRIIYTYYIRDFNLASINLPVGLFALCFSFIYGGYHWAHAIFAKGHTSLGIIMLSALTFLIGFQLLITSIQFDISNIPTDPITDDPPHIG